MVLGEKHTGKTTLVKNFIKYCYENNLKTINVNLDPTVFETQFKTDYDI